MKNRKKNQIDDLGITALDPNGLSQVVGGDETGGGDGQSGNNGGGGQGSGGPIPPTIG